MVLGGSHELGRGLSATASATGERLSRNSTTFNLPYHMVASGTLSYAMGEGMTLAGTYSHISYREEPGESAGSVEVNRGIVELRKVF